MVLCLLSVVELVCWGVIRSALSILFSDPLMLWKPFRLCLSSVFLEASSYEIISLLYRCCLCFSNQDCYIFPLILLTLFFIFLRVCLYSSLYYMYLSQRVFWPCPVYPSPSSSHPLSNVVWVNIHGLWFLSFLSLILFFNYLVSVTAGVPESTRGHM